MELETHLQPGLRIRAPDSSLDSTPPFPLNLFVGIPTGELRTLAHANPAQRDRLDKFARDPRAWRDGARINHAAAIREFCNPDPEKVAA